MDEIKITEDKKPEGNKDKMLRSVVIIVVCVVMLGIAFAVGGCVKEKKNNAAESDSTQSSQTPVAQSTQSVTVDVNALASALAGATTQPDTSAVTPVSTDASALESSTDTTAEASDISTSQTETTRVKYTYDTEDFAQNISGDFRFSLDSGKATVIGYFGNGGVVAVPKYLKGYPVIAIGQNAFSGTGGGGGETITSISLPSGLERIGNKAFSSCTALKAVTLPSTLTYIGNYAFEGCTALTSITIPESVSEVGKGCFASCSALTNVSLPQSGCVVGEECFAGCPYTYIP